jgi:hypothetical protein
MTTDEWRYMGPNRETPWRLAWLFRSNYEDIHLTFWIPDRRFLCRVYEHAEAYSRHHPYWKQKEVLDLFISMLPPSEVAKVAKHSITGERYGGPYL